MSSRPKKMEKAILALMRETGTRPELIYAYERTGLLLIEESYNALSPEDRAEYDGAIDEYFAKIKPK